MGTTTCVGHIDWLVGWNATAACHEFMRDAYLLYEGDTIVSLGLGTAPAADEFLSGAGLMIVPGLINLHSHPAGELAYRGVREEHGVPGMYMTGLYERLQAFSLSAVGQHACAEATFAELLMSGVTTLVDISAPYDGWLDLLAQSGVRAYAAPSFASARHVMHNRHGISYEWAHDGGRQSYEQACAVMERADAHECGRLAAMVSPSTMDDVSAELLRESKQLANVSHRPFTVHAAESVLEVQNMIAREGVTSIRRAAELDLLDERTILGHALFLDEHSWIQWHTRDDLNLMAQSGCAVAHCPTPFSRYGHVLEDFGRYRTAGVTLGIGTDTLPANMVDEIRTATVLGRIAARHVQATSLREVFDAATVGGAKALGRGDIGKLTPGAKADWFSVDLSHPYMRPIRDPLRSLFFSAGERAIVDVYVGGEKVVEQGIALNLNQVEALDTLELAQQQMLADAAENDFLARDADTIAPLSLPVAER